MWFDWRITNRGRVPDAIHDLISKVLCEKLGDNWLW